MAIPQTNFKPPFDITRASHLVLTAQDLAASKAFYTEVLGLLVSNEDANTLWLRGVEERQHHSLTLKRTISEPSSISGSQVPQTVAARIASAPCAFRARMLAWWVTWLEMRSWPSRWRETWSTSTPLSVPSVK